MEETQSRPVPLGGYPKELREKALELQKQGYNKTKIVESLGLGRTTVRRWLKQGEHTYYKPHPLELRQKAIDLVKSGESRMEASKQLGVSYFTVVFWCRSLDWSTRSRKPAKSYPRKLKLKVRRLAKAGISKRKISVQFGLSYQKVLTWTADIQLSKDSGYLNRLLNEGCIIAKPSELPVLRELSMNLQSVKHVVIGLDHIIFLQEYAQKALATYISAKKFDYLSAKRLASMKTLFYYEP